FFLSRKTESALLNPGGKFQALSGQFVPGNEFLSGNNRAAQIRQRTDLEVVDSSEFLCRPGRRWMLAAVHQPS
ncbi:MAG: hypothetical protein KDA85_05455, partial [Planctomycetaceae bacterium]|nr:hypothetical protein [Planctomycetaceae bacterium]